MKKITFMTLAIIMILSGCTWVGTKENVQLLEKGEIDISQSFYMIYPTNGIEQTYFTASITESETSAKDASDVFYKKFYKKFGSLVISDENVSLEQGFKTAKARGDKYLIAMDINEWKDTFYMTCQPSPQVARVNDVMYQVMDTADITISVYDVNSQKLLNKQRVQNRGCPMSILVLIPIGKMSPDSRFNSSLDKWLENL
ncbi:MAG: DUF4823 domain-containing protein [Rickettsiales bacterium]|jgi:hypothetical protein|nr:DUF4823 domain-containing protein [Rickettsiales bacterium]